MIPYPICTHHAILGFLGLQFLWTDYTEKISLKKSTLCDSLLFLKLSQKIYFSFAFFFFFLIPIVRLIFILLPIGFNEEILRNMLELRQRT